MATNLRFMKHETRAALLARMAADLVRYGAHREERAAMRTLSGLGYAMGDIIDKVDEAREIAAEQSATEDAVTTAMAER